MSEVLHAIHREALKLARRDDLPAGAREGLDLILKLSLYKVDIRSQKEKEGDEEGQ